MKKFLLLFAALLTLGVSARAADGDEFTVDNLKYLVSSETEHEASLIGFVEEPEGDLSIPAEVTNNGNSYSVTEIGYGLFSDCTGLISVEIPNSVTGIGDYAFCRCTGLNSVKIPNSVTYIGECAFGGCTGLTSVEIPNSVTEIGKRAFTASGLTSVEIPNSVTDIGFGTFFWCEGLTSVTIPNSVTNIGWQAFRMCTGLTTIIVYATRPPSCYSYSLTFEYVPQSAVVYIPKGTLNEYAAAEGWNYFTDFREMEDSGIEGVEAGGDSVEFFNFNGVRANGDALAPGLYIRRQGGKTAKVLVK